MTPKRLSIALGGLALAALLAVGLAQLARTPSASEGSGAAPTQAQTRLLLAGSPAPLAALHAQAGELLGLGTRGGGRRAAGSGAAAAAGGSGQASGGAAGSVAGDADALRARLAALHGWPLVVNKWASWCQSCRAEFGSLQRASAELGRRVAFLGIDSGDTSHADALGFLRSHPVSYPSYYDPSGHVGSALTKSPYMPVTVFYDAHGGEYIHQGPYLSAAELERDVKTYALGA